MQSPVVSVRVPAPSAPEETPSQLGLGEVAKEMRPTLRHTRQNSLGLGLAVRNQFRKGFKDIFWLEHKAGRVKVGEETRAGY